MGVLRFAAEFGADQEVVPLGVQVIGLSPKLGGYFGDLLPGVPPGDEQILLPAALHHIVLKISVAPAHVDDPIPPQGAALQCGGTQL